MYELFILGELTAGSKHGYVLQDILKNAMGPFRQISAGTLYPLLTRLVRQGLIRQRPENGRAGARERKVYEITDAGRARFRALMESPLEYGAETELVFQCKLVYFRFVPKEVRLACLEQYLRFLRHNWKHVDDCEFLLNMQLPEPEAQRVQLLRVFDRRKRVIAADIAWVENELERTRAEEEDGEANPGGERESRTTREGK